MSTRIDRAKSQRSTAAQLGKSLANLSRRRQSNQSSRLEYAPDNKQMAASEKRPNSASSSPTGETSSTLSRMDR
jgi:hypothetical protein